MVFGIDDALLAALISAGGAIGGGLLSSRGGKKDKFRQTSNFTPEMSELLKSLIQGSTPEQGYLSQLMSGSPEAFQAFEAPYLQQYQEEIIPHIAERFAGMGSGAGGLNSSGLYNTLAQSGKNLQTNLAGLRSGLGLDAAKTLFGGKLTALQARPFENVYQQGSQGGGGAGSALANILPLAFMGLGKGTGGGGGGYTPQYNLTGEYSNQLRSNPGLFGY